MGHNLLFDDWDIDLCCVDFLIELGWKFRGTQQFLIHIRGNSIHVSAVTIEPCWKSTDEESAEWAMDGGRSQNGNCLGDLDGDAARDFV